MQAMMFRLLITLCLLLAAPLAGAAGQSGAHDHRMHAAHATQDLAPATAGGAAIPGMQSIAPVAPGCHLAPAGESSGGGGHTFTHACCAPAALVHVTALADLRPAARSAQHGSWLRLSLAPRVQRIFHPPRQFS